MCGNLLIVLVVETAMAMIEMTGPFASSLLTFMKVLSKTSFSGKGTKKVWVGN
jgi:hypothetical protein